MIQLPDRIVKNPDILFGRPSIRGTRISVELILELLGAGQTEAEILDDYPGLTHEDVLACIEYAAQLVQLHGNEPVHA
ncbi:hypothetical protein F183_A34160 [Bryobacterales bacterium F-183]|nr:hypothetical protein F183_A34160 [Bryobacterales bacterium F-183]